MKEAESIKSTLNKNLEVMPPQEEIVHHLVHSQACITQCQLYWEGRKGGSQLFK